MAGQPTGGDPMRDADRQAGETALADLAFNIVRGGELAQCFLYGDLPRTGCRHHDQIGGIGNRIPA